MEGFLIFSFVLIIHHKVANKKEVYKFQILISQKRKTMNFVKQIHTESILTPILDPQGSQKNNKILDDQKLVHSQMLKQQSVLNSFKNNSELKQQVITSNVCQINVNTGKKSTHQYKIVPAHLINKIQQSRPQYKNNIIHKQLADDIFLQSENSYKVQNCISPARPNSEIYKRLSKDFFQNISNGIDQCILFTGVEPYARIQSSIGTQNNPGIFMIVAIAILDQKYQQNHQNFDVQFSFLEYRSEKIFDLLNYTGIPLQVKMKEHSKNGQKYADLQFCEHRVKVCTFLHFIKLFKIALFNNKERDIGNSKQTQHNSNNSNNANNSNNSNPNKIGQFASTFIMKIKIKKYSNEGILVYQQQTSLIDFDQNSGFKTNGQKSSQVFEERLSQLAQNPKKSAQIGNRSLLDYILIEINNSNPSSKFIRYHMVQKNLLLEIIKKYLRHKPSNLPQTINNSSQELASKFLKKEPKQNFVGGSLFVINSFTNSPLFYTQNIEFYESLMTSIGSEWKASVKPKEIQAYFMDKQLCETILKKIINSIKNKKYDFLRDLYMAKQFYVLSIKKIIKNLKYNRNLFLQYFNQKRSVHYCKNVFTAYQLQLIGKCIKSDNFKEFYTSKSFVALPRQVQIKTQKVKYQIIRGMEVLKQIQQKFRIIRKKQQEENRTYSTPFDSIKKNYRADHKLSLQILDGRKRQDVNFFKNKFTIIEFQSNLIGSKQDEFQSLKSLKKYINDYFYSIWTKANLTQERTIASEIIFEDFFITEIQYLQEILKASINQIEVIQERMINFRYDGELKDQDQISQLIKLIDNTKNYNLKSKLKIPIKLQESYQKLPSTSKKQNIYQIATNLPKIQEAQLFKRKREKSVSTKNKVTKNKGEVFEINAKVNFEILLLKPKKLV